MYTGFAASESVKLPPDSRAIVKSGAAGPSGGGFGTFVDEESCPGCGDEVPDDDVGAVDWDVSPAPVSGAGDAHAAATSARASKTALDEFVMGERYPHDPGIRTSRPIVD